VTKEALYNALNYVNHSREKRQEMANLVSGNPKLIDPLFAIAFLVDDPVSSRACWVLEFTITAQLELIVPHLDFFTKNIGTLRLDSSIRPMAKICEHLITDYFSMQRKISGKHLNENHLERITSACFDWLIGDNKVAAKAYSMTSLYYLGTKYDWIHSELRMVIEQNYVKGSAAYKARARHTLKKLK